MSQGVFDEFLAWLGVPEDPWSSVSAPIPYEFFGAGSRRPFPWYFEGLSRVEVSSLEDVERWLMGCEYVSDRALFGEEDHWQHPGEFEVIRMGDCDDHALWAWRKLVELGYPTSLVFGKWDDEPADLHTWLLTTVAGRRQIFEATSKILGDAMRPFDQARHQYRPYFSVDERFKTRAYLGRLQDIFSL